MQNYALRMAGSILEKLRVFSVKIWTKTEIVLNCDGRRVDFGKTEGFICKNDHGWPVFGLVDSGHIRSGPLDLNRTTGVDWGGLAAAQSAGGGARQRVSELRRKRPSGARNRARLGRGANVPDGKVI